MHIRTGQPDEFGSTQPGLGGEEEQRMVTLAGPGGAVWAGQEGLNLGTSQKADERSVESLGRNSEHPLDELGVLGVAKRGVAEQRMDIAANLALRVRTLLPRSCSRWSRKPAIRVASRSAMSSCDGGLYAW